MKAEAEEKELDALELASSPPELADIVVVVSTPLYPTEDGGAVRQAVANMFPTIELAAGGGRMWGETSGPEALARLRRRLREMRIRDTARSVIGSSIDGDALTFSLNKQSAYARVPNFSTGGAPLGDIDVTLKTAHPAAVAEWLCKTDLE